jgi:inorganic pyrophosphatase
MKRPKQARESLSCLPVYDRETGDVTVVVETPKGSHNKYKYDPDCRALRLGAVLAEGLSFPYDFGFVPSTLGEDGDPLDVLLFLDHGVPPASVVTARLIGVLEVRQRDQGEKKWKRNDRFFAVATHAHAHQHLHGLADLRAHLVDEVESFFVHYAGLNGKTLEVLARRDPAAPSACSRPAPGSTSARHETGVHRESLEEASTHVGGEARMLLPGVQTILGFQLMAVFNQRFEQFTPASRSCTSPRSCWWR